MKAVLLAAGYATRLGDAAGGRPKPLIPVAGRPIVDYVCDRIDEVAEVDELHLVTNSRFAEAFAAWADERSGRLRARVHDDGTSSNDERLGAIADLLVAVEEGGLAGDDLLVVAGDNLFEFSLREQVAFWRSKDGEQASCVAVHRCPERERLSLYGVVELDPSGRVVGFVEKPSRPASDLIATAAYILGAAHVSLIDSYLAEGNSPDQPGNFLAWLYRREPVYGFAFEELWLDIGDPEQLQKANELYTSRPA
jgi:glucose-1-phosphate thymidylyltransferase